MSLPFSEACERNKQPILEALDRLLPTGAKVLEVGAGTGQHAVHFTRQRQDLHWLSTDLPERLAGLAARFEAEAGSREIGLRALDVASDDWPEGPFDAVFTANTLHIMAWPLTERLLSRVPQLLIPQGLLILYGPFQDRGVHSAESNRQFDRHLRARDPAMGVRDAVEIAALAEARGLRAVADLALPANNRLLVFRKS